MKQALQTAIMLMRLSKNLLNSHLNGLNRIIIQILMKIRICQSMKKKNLKNQEVVAEKFKETTGI